MNKRWIRRLLFTLIIIAIIVPAVMAAGWIGTETVVEKTSDAEFCSSCHTMEPFATSHEQDVHGGNNPGGVVAHCTDCHLPHDDAAQHLLAKAKTGTHDAIAQAIYPIHKPDWIANLEERAEYVYDSGCLSCHAALKDATSDDAEALAAHKAYFGGDVGAGCVSCHEHVGHQDLKVMLDDHFDEVSLSENPDDNGDAAADPPAPAEERETSEQNATSREDA
ncbi:MAG: cytochrome c3 family protein [Halochromatium sp.]